ncbi:hypothetical protein [Haloferax sp. Atlit-6N]|uniref:hypothetical protein n=1 Tax=Haloferax sp. Atlit-6N TaxID=2077205 RepID=UPI0018F3FF65|nr:hypothetical protein [Haloferax sp. Atlit-6N]
MEPITVTVLIEGFEYLRRVEGTHWARDGERNLYVYDGDLTVLEVTDGHVVEVCRESHVETIAVRDRTNSTDHDHGPSDDVDDDDEPDTTTTTTERH